MDAKRNKKMIFTGYFVNDNIGRKEYEEHKVNHIY